MKSTATVNAVAGNVMDSIVSDDVVACVDVQAVIEGIDLFIEITSRKRLKKVR